MLGRSHLLLAGAAYAALAVRPLETPLGRLTAPVLGGPEIPEGSGAVVLSLAIAAMCGLAPDLDKAGSTAARSLGVVTRLLSWGIERGLGHRKAFHSLLGVGFGYLVGEFLGRALGLTGLGALVAFGWSAHLITDAWTIRGIPVFWPLPIGPVRLPPWISTGSWEESLLLTAALIALLYYATAGQVPHPWATLPAPNLA
jgi:membrane-bound metal-dependent hydrolase YbcI (DUF457 family)